MVEKSTVLVVAISISYLTFQFAPFVELPYVNQVGEKLWDLEDQIISKINSWIGNRKIQSKEEGTQEKNEPSSTLEPPDVDVSISMNDKYYLGNRPTVEFTVTNNGGSCEVNYTAFETQQESGSFQLDSNDTRTITETGRQVRKIGDYRTSVDVEASNESGTDTAKDEIWFQVTFHHIDGTEYIDHDELNHSDELISEIGTVVDRFLNVGFASLVTPDSSTIQALANKFKEYHPNNKEILARDLYYWTIWWLEYEGDFSTQWEIPVETIEDRDGVCINYAAVLASLYEACGLDAKVMALWNEEWYGIKRVDQHAALLLYLRGLNQGDYYEDGWLYLDPTWGEGSNGWKFGEWHHDYEERDIADVE